MFSVMIIPSCRRAWSYGNSYSSRFVIQHVILPYDVRVYDISCDVECEHCVLNVPKMLMPYKASTSLPEKIPES